MPTIDTYRKQAKQLVRWHRSSNYSIGAKVRLLERFRHLDDAQILAMPLPLTLAQEIVAVEAGFLDWMALRTAAASVPTKMIPEPPAARIHGAVPIFFVRDVTRAASFYRDRLGFDIDFLYGQPPFYGSVSRGGACLHLRFVGEPNFAELAASECGLVLASFEVTGVKALFAEFVARGADIVQPLTRQAWGGLTFHVRDPDGNVVSFAEYRMTTPAESEVHL